MMYPSIRQAMENLRRYCHEADMECLRKKFIPILQHGLGIDAEVAEVAVRLATREVLLKVGLELIGE